jgi:hypothetical protein
MSYNQDIRSGPPNPNNKNNPNNLYDFIRPSRSIKGSGAPGPDVGQDYYTYTDTDSGVEYQKSGGVWEPFLNLGSFAPPAVIPDPLQLSELDTDLIKGNVSDNITIDGNVAGNVQVLIGSGQAFQVGQPGALDTVVIQNNGNVLAGSKVRGFELESAGGSHDIQIKNGVSGGLIENLTGPLEIKNSAVGDLNINAAGANTKLNLSATRDMVLSSGAALELRPTNNIECFGALDLKSGGIQRNDGNDIDISNLSSGGRIDMFAQTGNILFRGTGGGQIQTEKDINMQTKNIINANQITGDNLSVSAPVGNLTLDSASFINLNSTMNFGLNDVVNADQIQGPSLRIRADTTDLLLDSDNGNVNLTSTTGTTSKTTGIHKFTNILNNDIVTIEGNTGNGRMTVSGLPFVGGNKIEVDGIGSIKKIGTGDLNIQHNETNGNINLLTDGGVIRMQDGPNAMTFDPEAKRATMEKIVIQELNFSASKTDYTILGTNNTGVLDFRQAPRTVSMSVSAFGSNNATDYFGLGENVAPSDFWALPIGGAPAVLTSYCMQLMSNAEFTFGGGSCSLQIGYVPLGSVCTAANYVILHTTVINTAVPLYQICSGPVAEALPASCALVARIFTAGIAASSTNNELALSVTYQ